MQAMTAKLAGRRYRDGDIQTLSQLDVRHEVDNAVDANAVAIVDGDDVIGYLERGLASIVAPLLDRGRPVLASPIKGKTAEINLFIPEPYERISSSGHLVRVPSSDGARTYVVDTRRGLCTCPVGRHIRCRHQKALGVQPPTPPAAAVVAASPAVEANNVIAFPTEIAVAQQVAAA